MAKKIRRRYKGARRTTGFLIPLLVVLCIIAAILLFIVNNNMIYTEDGAYFSMSGKVEDEAPPSVDANLVIEDATDDNNVAPDTPVIADEPSQSDVRHGYFLPIGTVKNTELLNSELSSLKDKDINMLVFEVKAEDGTLAFSSDHPFVREGQLSGDDALLSGAVASAKENGFDVAFLISCFKDNGAARNNFTDAVLAQGGGVWRDENEMRWLNPYSEAANDFLCGIIKKLSEFSPDEIILSNVSFPFAGQTGKISYGDVKVSKGDALTAFAKKASEASGDIPLSAVYENYSDAYRAASGQTVSLFRDSFSALYANAAAGKYSLSFEAVKEALNDTDYPLIIVSDTASDTSKPYIIKK